MKAMLVLIATVPLMLTACGGDDSPDTASGGTGGDVQATVPADQGSGGAGASGAVVDPPPPGRATASVDGLELAFEEPGAVACTIGDGEFGFSFRIGDNEITLGGGGFRTDSGWSGAATIVVANPEGEAGPVQYDADLTENGDTALAFDGSSMSYAGPVQKQPANDGSNPPPVEVGDGTISVTCP